MEGQFRRSAKGLEPGTQHGGAIGRPVDFGTSVPFARPVRWNHTEHAKSLEGGGM